MKRPRLIMFLMSAFALVIVTSVCGIIGFLGLSFAGEGPASSFRDELHEVAPSYAAILTDYYLANDSSWAGVDQRLKAPPFSGSATFYSYTIFDPQGDLIAGSDPRAFAVSIPAKPGAPEAPDASRWPQRRSLPIERTDLIARGRTVGILVVRPDFDPSPAVAPNSDEGPPSFLSTVWRHLLFVGIGIGSMLFILAMVFARRINRPLQNLTAASKALAEGQLDVRVPSASVRELDELGHAFNNMAASLSTADAQRRQMTADIAHELRTPLSIIRGRLEGVQDGIYEATPEQLDGLLHETALLERLVDDLRLLALAEAGQLPLYREASDPRQLVEHVADSFRDQATRQDVRLLLDTGSYLPDVDVDPQRIAQVLGNLISNALIHTPAGGSVTLSASYSPTPVRQLDAPKQRSTEQSRALLSPAFITIQISDTGSGISPEDLPRIFDRFWRADRARARSSGGAGLGLAIVKQIIDAHGGSVDVISLPGQGTTFRVQLPVASSPA
jgi:signal transduction histidine kinase